MARALNGHSSGLLCLAKATSSVFPRLLLLLWCDITIPSVCNPYPEQLLWSRWKSLSNRSQALSSEHRGEAEREKEAKFLVHQRAARRFSSGKKESVRS